MHGAACLSSHICAPSVLSREMMRLAVTSLCSTASFSRSAQGKSVSISWLDRSLILILTAFIFTNPAQAWPHRHSGKKARVHFVAESTLIRTSWGWNEDTYLAELRFSKQNESVLVRLVDAYPNEAPPLSYATLTAQLGTSLCGGDYAEAIDASGDLKHYDLGDVLVLAAADAGEVEKTSCHIDHGNWSLRQQTGNSRPKRNPCKECSRKPPWP